jgi:hypothetical protein
MPEATNLQSQMKVRESDEQDSTLGTMEMAKLFKVQ